MGKATLTSSTWFGYRFRWIAGIAIFCALGLAASEAQAKSWTLRSGRGIRFTLTSTTGRYRLFCPQTHWVYRGKMAKPPQNIRQSAVDTHLGKGLRLSWKEAGSSAQYAVVLYPSRQAVVFSAKTESAGTRFPAFTHVPQGLPQV